MSKSAIIEHAEENMDQQTLERWLRLLVRQGYSAEQAGETIVVKDPVHRCGFGPDAGRLVLDGYVDRTLTSSKAIMKFLDDRN